MNAVISHCGQYRYSLSRPGDLMMASAPHTMFLMLNPSTATRSSTRSDNPPPPRIRRDVGHERHHSRESLHFARQIRLRSGYTAYFPQVADRTWA
jgi:hypothetical protein